MAFVKCCSLLFLVSLAHAATIDQSFNMLQEKKIPPIVILGKNDGSIARCLKEMPSFCDVYYKGDSKVNAVLVHGEFLFAGLQSGKLLRCVWKERNSCVVFHEVTSAIRGLAVTAGYLHAGTEDGRILGCKLNTSRSCLSSATLGRKIASLAATESHVYAGVDKGQIHRCNVSGNNCTLFCKSSRRDPNYDVTGVTIIGDLVYGVLNIGYLQYGNGKSDVCGGFELTGLDYTDMTSFTGDVYIMTRRLSEIRFHVPGSNKSTVYSEYSGAVSIAIAYGTYAMDDTYVMESKKCIYEGILCPPTVVYYDAENRLPFEIHVKNNRLYDSQGARLDTSDADEGYAIFAMGPDGQILLSKMHRRGLVHTSSMLAGGAAAGAGRMVVDQGRITSITACSEHYHPDQRLNEQVIQALRTKGYTEPVDSRPCTDNQETCNQSIALDLNETVNP